MNYNEAIEHALSKSPYSVKGVKSFRGHDGMGFNAILYRGDVKVAFVYDGAFGGCFDYQWYANANAELQKLLDFCASLPKYEDTEYECFKGKEFGIDADMLVSALVERAENDQRFKRHCKTKTLIRLKGDEEGTYRTYKHIYDDKMKAFLKAKHGNNIEEILNEKYLVSGK